MNRNKKLFIILFVLLSICVIYLVDKSSLMLKRVETQNWQSRGVKDYVIVGKDLLDRTDYKLENDTLILIDGKNVGKQFVVKYCILGNLWIKSIDKNETAWYINP